MNEDAKYYEQVKYEALNDGCMRALSTAPTVDYPSDFKVDLVMWVKNGERTLDRVLKRINQVIPKRFIGQKIIVNDHSTDGTAYIIFANHWRQVNNCGFGISDAANLALSLVRTKYFCSFEQDVLLAKDWWPKISKLIVNRKGVVAASGVRFLNQNHFCFNIEPYLSCSGVEDYGKTLDNTLWNTSLLRGLGGFPVMDNAFCETILHHEISDKGLLWCVDKDTCSLHLHSSFLEELKHQYFYGLNMRELQAKADFKVNGLNKVMKSPFSALKMVLKMHDPRLFIAYPLCRLAWLGGYLHKA